MYVYHSEQPKLTERFVDALQYTTRLHSQQVRKASDVPYVAHLLSVAALVAEHGGDEDETIAALLHDAVEDQGGAGTREEIRERFGERVVGIVDGCTECETTLKFPWRERKQQHIEHLRDAPAEVLRVVVADKIHNVRSLLMDLRRHGDELWECFNGGRDGTLWYYRQMADLTRKAVPWEMAAELERELSELERMAGVLQEW